MSILSGKSATALLMVFCQLLIPPLIFALVALSGSMSISETLQALIAQYQGSKQNLLVIGLLGCIPLLLLALILWLHRRFGGSPAAQNVLLWSGFVPIVLIHLWANLEYWPNFLPARVYPGFPHGLEFVIGTFFYAPAGMLICMWIAWLAARRNKG